MKKIILVILMTGLLGCANTGPQPRLTHDKIVSEMDKAVEQRNKASAPEAINNALLPPLRLELPKTTASALEPRFDLVVNSAPASQVFMAIVSGTRYNMLVHPEVAGTISVNLKDVSVPEALLAIRDLYGYSYKVDGNRIFVQPLTLQTRVFQVNYLIGSRLGKTEVRVTSGSVSDNAGSTTTGSGTTNTNSGGTNNKLMESSRISTSSQNDFWSELSAALKAIIGNEPGRNVVISPQSGVVVVKAMPLELRDIEAYLRATRLAVERQVMLEAKIIEVELTDAQQSGINWAAFRRGSNSRTSIGQAQPGTIMQGSGSLVTGASGISGSSGAFTVTEPTISALPGTDLVNLPVNSGSLFGLAFQTSNFAALLNFLQTQGNVQVLSSPRIATLNNQKAVLKVGTDEFFVTAVTSNTSTTGTTTTSSPTVTVQPFFSGIALDVTPQIDENGNIILHIHPSVSTVSTDTKTINLGSTAGNLSLPLAKSNVSETDSIVRVEDTNIVAIGGLMKVSSSDSLSQLPGVGDVPVLGEAFKNKSKSMLKKELVILLKPTIIKSDKDWENDLVDVRDRLQGMQQIKEQRR